MDKNHVYDLLENVNDRNSFILFVEALADKREQARKIERDNPKRYVVDGALEWANGDISSFLYACNQYFVTRPFHSPEAEPSWKMFAKYLYFGKIYE